MFSNLGVARSNSWINTVLINILIISEKSSFTEVITPYKLRVTPCNSVVNNLLEEFFKDFLISNIII
jgi:hypothetical protein